MDSLKENKALNNNTLNKPLQKWLITALLITLLLTGLVWIQHRATQFETDPLAINAPMQVKRSLASSLADSLREITPEELHTSHPAIKVEEINEDYIKPFVDKKIAKNSQQKKAQAKANKRWEKRLSQTISYLTYYTNALATVSAKHKITPIIKKLQRPIESFYPGKKSDDLNNKQYIEAFKELTILNNIVKALSHKFDRVVNYAAYMLGVIKPKNAFIHQALATALYNDNAQARYTIALTLWYIIPQEPSVRTHLTKIALLDNPPDTQKLILQTVKAIEKKYGR